MIQPEIKRLRNEIGVQPHRLREGIHWRSGGILPLAECRWNKLCAVHISTRTPTDLESTTLPCYPYDSEHTTRKNTGFFLKFLPSLFNHR